MLRFLFITGAFIGALLGVGKLGQRQYDHATARCHCECGAVAGDWPELQELLPSELRPGETVGAYERWGGGALVCLAPNEPDPSGRLQVIQDALDRDISRAEAKGGK